LHEEQISKIQSHPQLKPSSLPFLKLHISRLPNALKLQIDALTMECDNRQTIRLLVEEAAKLQTKLRHVDIHRHC